MHLTRRTRIAVAVATVALVGGGGAAIAATRAADDRGKAVLDDAAKRLGVTPQKLSDALTGAKVDQLAADVKAGRLTQAQADAIEQRLRAAPDGAGLGGPGFGGRGDHGGRHGLGRGFGPGGAGLDAAATYLGVTPEALRTAREAGKSLAAVAKEKGKSEAGLIAAIKGAVTKDLDAAVKAGRLTQAQRDAMASGLDARVKADVEDTDEDGPGHHGPWDHS
jgi:hypothetical protein